MHPDGTDDSKKVTLAIPPAAEKAALPPPPERTALPPVSNARSPTKSRRLGWLLFLLAAGLVGYFFATHRSATTSAAKPGNAGKQGRAAPAIPVVTATATRGNMPVYLTGLGTVTAFNTVTVRTRVDGELIKIYFKEGEFVREGDPLAEIDPRPYQVQLEQAEESIFQACLFCVSGRSL
jgi:multidrug efflux pump subunit AcrA (membrane-fusion protein)